MKLGPPQPKAASLTDVIVGFSPRFTLVKYETGTSQFVSNSARRAIQGNEHVNRRLARGYPLPYTEA